MNYYTVSGVNINKFFNLGFNERKYYDWDEVRGKVLEMEGGYGWDELEKNLVNFQEVIDGRKRRERQLKSEFDKYGIKFIPHSYLIRNYVMYGRRTKKEVVRRMYMMKILYEKCDILDKWEKNKVEKGQQVYTFEEKDKFYEDYYKEFVKNNPRYKFR